MPWQNKERVNVLLVDDQPGKLLSYEVMLEELDENLVPASSAKEALAYLLKSEVAVILVDVCMPELDGFELAQMIREHPRFQKTAIIFISAIHMSETDYLRGYEAGAVDYLSVPVVPELLRAKVRVFAELFRKTRELQQLNEELEKPRGRAHRGAGRSPPTSCATASRAGAWRWPPAIWAPGTAISAADTWFWDEGQSRIFGVDHDELRCRRWRRSADCIHPDDLAAFREAIRQRCRRRQPSCDIELRIVRPNGEVRWCRLAAAAPSTARACCCGFSGVTTDITERKEAESRQALLAREVDHRAKNALAVVQAIVRLAKRDNIEELCQGGRGPHQRPGPDP